MSKGRGRRDLGAESLIHPGDPLPLDALPGDLDACPACGGQPKEAVAFRPTRRGSRLGLAGLIAVVCGRCGGISVAKAYTRPGAIRKVELELQALVEEAMAAIGREH